MISQVRWFFATIWAWAVQKPLPDKPERSPHRVWGAHRTNDESPWSVATPPPSNNANIPNPHRICVNCTHYKELGSDDVCLNVKPENVDLVSGKQTLKPVLCSWNRSTDGNCRPAGILYTPTQRGLRVRTIKNRYSDILEQTKRDMGNG